MANVITFYGEQENNSLGTICEPPRFQNVRILLTMTLKFFSPYKPPYPNPKYYEQGNVIFEKLKEKQQKTMIFFMDILK